MPHRAARRRTPPAVTFLLLLALATPPGAHAFIGVTSWVGGVYGRWVAHTITTDSSPGATR